MRSFKHWTASYVYSRSKDIGWRLVHPGRPWLTPTAIRFLEGWLKPGHTVFEWGAGRSTLWFARRVQNVVTVEHDPVWFLKIRSEVSHLKLNNVEILFIADNQDPISPMHYVGAFKQVARQCDLVLVDGIHRELCALAALNEVKPGGLLLVDNANWYLPSSTRSPASRTREQGPASSQWADFERHTRSWARIWTSNGVFDTVIWIRPQSVDRSCRPLSPSTQEQQPC